MAEGIFISIVIAFVKLLSPLVAVAAIVLFLRPQVFVDIEKKALHRNGGKKTESKSNAASREGKYGITTAFDAV